MATVTRFVNTSADAGGNGANNTESSGDNSHAYASLNAWEAAEQTNLVTAGDVHVCNCDRGSTSGTDNTLTAISGWTTDATNFITIQGNRGSSNGFNNGATFDETTFYTIELDGSQGRIVDIQEGYTVFDGIQFLNSTGSHGRETMIFGSGFADGVMVKNCRFKATGAGQTKIGIQVTNTGATDGTIENCTFEGFDTTGSCAIQVTAGGWVVRNCTIEGGVDAISLTSAIAGAETFQMHNCATFNNSGSDLADSSSGTLTFDYNATDDPASGTGNPRGTNGVDLNDNASSEWTNAFTDYTTGDFRVKDASSALYDAGSAANRSATDILGNSWTTDDIGAFAFVAAAGSRPQGPLSHPFMGAFGGPI